MKINVTETLKSVLNKNGMEANDLAEAVLELKMYGNIAGSDIDGWMDDMGTEAFFHLAGEDADEYEPFGEI